MDHAMRMVVFGTVIVLMAPPLHGRAGGRLACLRRPAGATASHTQTHALRLVRRRRGFM